MFFLSANLPTKLRTSIRIRVAGNLGWVGKAWVGQALLGKAWVGKAWVGKLIWISACPTSSPTSSCQPALADTGFANQRLPNPGFAHPPQIASGPTRRFGQPTQIPNPRLVHSGRGSAYAPFPKIAPQGVRLRGSSKPCGVHAL